MQLLIRRYKYYIIYTVVFMIMTAAVFYPFFHYGKLVIWNGEARDGLVQHYNALLYYSHMLKDSLHALLQEHTLRIQEYSFSLGMGSDTIRTLHYYAIGDPLNLLSCFVPESKIYLLYCLLVFVRLYLAGISFSVFAINKGNKNTSALLAGCVVYIFCGFVLHAAVRHPYFINPMIYLPLILTGVDRYIEKNKAHLYIISVAIAAMSNFYFLYMIAIITAVYIVITLIFTSKGNVAAFVKRLLGLIVSTILSACMASCILFPIIYTFLHDPRMDSEVQFHALYPVKYYLNFLAQFSSFSSIGAWTFMSYGVLPAVAVFLLFLLRKSKKLILFFVLATACLLIPLAGHILNGMSYPSNRWCFAYALLCAYILVKLWPDLLTMSRKNAVRTLIFLIVYSLAAFWLFPKEGIPALWQEIAIGLTAICIIAVKDPDQTGKAAKRTEYALLAAVLMAMFVNGYYCYSPDQTEYLSEFLYYGNFHKVIEKDCPDEKIKEWIDENGESILTRYSGFGFQRNSALRHGLSSTQFFWSLSNPNMAQYRTELLLIEDRAQSYTSFDDGTFLNLLAGVGYHATTNEGLQPYGYEKVDKTKDLTIYKNKYTLPIGYTYDSYFLRNEYDSLSAVEKAEAMMQGVLLEQEESALQTTDLQFTSGEMTYQILQPDDTDVFSSEDGFVAVVSDASVKIQVDGIANTETIMNLEQLGFEGTSRKTLYNDDPRIDPFDTLTPEKWKSLDAIRKHELERDDFIYNEPDELNVHIQAVREDGSKVTRLLKFGTPYYKWYANRKNYNINFGYSESPVKEVILSFPNRGIYSYEKLGFTYQPMTNYKEQTEKLARDVLRNPSFENDTFTGNIHLEQSKLLCIAIPYDEGWTAYVDGNKAQLLQANTAYMGLMLHPGDHEIKLVYKTPLLRVGAAVSAAGWLGYIVLLAIRFIRSRRVRPASGS